ncbi:MAG: phosphoribosylanthranilate isomerase [Candidatus Kapaibacterium sp.]
MRLIHPYLQAAGIKSLQEAIILMEAGFNYLGFPLRLDFHREDIPDNEVRKIVPEISPPCFPVLITYLTKSRQITELADYLNIKIIQLHAGISRNEIIDIKKKRNFTLIKSIIIKGSLEKAIETLKHYEDICDAFITDTYDPETGASGATGKVHDPDISRKIVELSSKPVIIAGGLNPGNIKKAIFKTIPFGVDVHTGIEDSSGNKSKVLAVNFIRNVLNAYEQLKN